MAFVLRHLQITGSVWKQDAATRPDLSEARISTNADLWAKENPMTSNLSSINVRPVQPSDNLALSQIIRSVLDEYDGNKPGFASMDPETDSMYEAYAKAGAAYYVLEQGNQVVGGGGFAPLAGGKAGVCELQKMYFLPEVRGTGWGQKMLALCIEAAQKAGYKQMYLETLAAMNTARALYQKFGFQYLEKQLGQTGHSGCNTFMMRDLA